MTLPKAKPGSVNALSSGTYNRMREATVAFEVAQANRVRTSATPYLIDVMNLSGEALPAYSSVTLLEPLVDPDANPREHRNLSGFKVTTVSDPMEEVRVAITQDAIPHNKIGRAMLIGVTPIMSITIEDEDHRKAKADVNGGFVSASSGPLEILWKSPEESSPRKAVVAMTQVDEVSIVNAWARVLNADPIQGAENQFDYELELVEWDTDASDWSIIEGQDTIQAINTLEAPNMAEGIQGNGVDADTLPQGFEVVPIGEGAVLRVSKLTDELWAFSVANLVDGEC